MRRVLVALSFALACQRAAPPAPQGESSMGSPNTAAVRFDVPRSPWLVRVEVARTEPERAKGLMQRRELPSDAGMLFVFDATEEHTFWMHDTLLPLDMIFLGEDRRVAGIVSRAQPLTDTPRTVGRPSRYVVEVLGGEAAAHGVVEGTLATFVDVRE